MSISDEKLASLAVGPTPEQENILLQMTGNEEAIEGALQHLRDVSDMAQELLAYREAERKSDMLTDSAWIAGAKFGWNCGVVGDNNALQASIESRIRERAEDKKERPK